MQRNRVAEQDCKGEREPLKNPKRCSPKHFFPPETWSSTMTTPSGVAWTRSRPAAVGAGSRTWTSTGSPPWAIPVVITITSVSITITPVRSCDTSLVEKTRRPSPARNGRASTSASGPRPGAWWGMWTGIGARARGWSRLRSSSRFRPAWSTSAFWNWSGRGCAPATRGFSMPNWGGRCAAP